MPETPPSATTNLPTSGMVLLGWDSNNAKVVPIRVDANGSVSIADGGGLPGGGGGTIAEQSFTLANSGDSFAVPSLPSSVSEIAVYANVSGMTGPEPLVVQPEVALTAAGNNADFHPIDAEAGVLPFPVDGSGHVLFGNDSGLALIRHLRVKRVDSEANATVTGIIRYLA